LSALDQWSGLRGQVRQTAAHVASAFGGGRRVNVSEADVRRAVFAGYPDRVGQRRAPQSPRLLLSSGAGATMAPQSGVMDGEFLVALDVQASIRPNDPDARVRLASVVDRDWLQPTAAEVVHRFDEARGVV